MFSKKQLNEKIDTLIGAESQITGDLTFSGGLHIEGSVVGEITCQDDMSSILVINKGGQVTGDISVPSAIIDGTVHGNVYTTNSFRLEELGFISTIRSGQYFVRRYFTKENDEKFGQTYDDFEV